MLVQLRGKQGSRMLDMSPASYEALEWGCARLKEPDVVPEFKNLVESFIRTLHQVQDHVDLENNRKWGYE